MYLFSLLPIHSYSLSIDICGFGFVYLLSLFFLSSPYQLHLSSRSSAPLERTGDDKKTQYDTITNANIRKTLRLFGSGERHFEIPPAGIGEYSSSTKFYRMREAPNSFFREVEKFLLKGGCVHTNAYRIPK